MQCSGATLIMTKHAPRHHVLLHIQRHKQHKLNRWQSRQKKTLTKFVAAAQAAIFFDLRQAHLALAALEAELVEDVASRLHPLGGIHRLGANGALFRLWWLKHTNAHR